MSSPFIWSGNFAKSLKSFLNLNDGVYILQGSSDPSSVATNGPAGSLYLRTNGSAYVKTDAGTSTNWTLFSTGASGGTVTSQLVTVPDNWSTSGNVLPAVLANSNCLVVGTKAYLFGGSPNGQINNASTATNKIYSADLTVDPTVFTDTGATLPAARFAGAVFQVGSNLYYVGGMAAGNTPQNTIWTATTAAPTVWSNTGATLPAARGEGMFGIFGTKLYIFGGQTGGGGASASIVSATIAAPTVWTTEGNSLVSARYLSSLFSVGDKIYLVGGINGSGNGTNTIYSAFSSAPTVWATESNTFPVIMDNAPCALIGDSVYVFGGESQTGGGGTTSITTIYRSTALNPTSFNSFTPALNVATQGQSLFFYNGKMYQVGGTGNSLSGSGLTTVQNTTNTISVNQPTYSGVSSSFGGPSFDISGEPWTLTTFNKLGFAPWWYDATKPF